MWHCRNNKLFTFSLQTVSGARATSRLTFNDSNKWKESRAALHEIFMRNAELFSDARVQADVSRCDDDAKTSSRNSSERRKDKFQKRNVSLNQRFKFRHDDAFNFSGKNRRATKIYVHWNMGSCHHRVQVSRVHRNDYAAAWKYARQDFSSADDEIIFRRFLGKSWTTLYEFMIWVLVVKYLLWGH